MSEDIFAPGFGTGAVEPAHRKAAPPIAGSLMPELRVWRVSHGLSQFEAAKRLGVSLSSWIRWETKGVPELRRAWLEEHCR